MGKSKKQKAFIKERDQAIKIHRFSKMIQVNDDWYPCYPHHQVSAHCGIFCGSMDPDTKDWSVFCVISGADDTCVEKRDKDLTKEQAIEKYEQYLAFINQIPEVTNKRWFLERGFEYG